MARKAILETGYTFTPSTNTIVILATQSCNVFGRLSWTEAQA